MSLAKARLLAQAWFPASGDRPLETAINAAFDRIGFTDEYVESSIDLHQRGQTPTKSKVIKDSVWGMVEVETESLRLLDSPVVQKTRGIHQLGFSYVTYPSAEHTRFIHSLGMYCVVSRFLDAIDRRRRDTPRVGNYDVEAVSPDLRKDVLHAALLHDIGHMPFSHASEGIFQASKELFCVGPLSVEDFTFEADDNLGKPLAFAECLSLAIVLAPRFRRFYTEYVRRDASSDSILRVASLIAGLPPQPDQLGAADLISASAIDADKVDYINRDSAACGIPIGLDVARLFLRSAYLRVPINDLQRLKLGELEGPCSVFVVNASGIDTVEELAQARANLYQRVYLRQTTRSAERLLAQALEGAAQREPGTELADALRLWAMHDFELLRRIGADRNLEVAALGRRLTIRQLPKRAAVFGRSTVEPVNTAFLPNIPNDEVVGIEREITGRALEDLRQMKLRGDQLRKLEEAIGQEATRLADALRRVTPEIVPTGTLPILTAIPIPHLDNSRKHCIVLENNELFHTSALTIYQPQMDAADIYKALGYVSTDPAWREIVFVAARTVLYTARSGITNIGFHPYPESELLSVSGDRRVRLSIDGVVRRASLSRERVAEILAAADSIGYFDRTPYLGTPVGINARIREIASRLSQFDGQGEWRVTPASCAQFIRQFPQRLREEISSLLSTTRVLDRAEVVAGLRAAIDAFGPLRNGKGFITGLTPDSGNVVRMLLDQELRDYLDAKGWVVAKTVGDALGAASPGDGLVFCDDNSSSGSQAESQLLAWFDVPRTEWPSSQQKEHGISDVPLSEDERGGLRRLDVAVAVCIGTREADSRLRGRAAALGIASFRGVLRGRELEERGPELSGPLKNFLAAVGSDLLAFCRFGSREGVASLPPADQASARRDALGYSGKAAFLATYFSVPTSSVTALWCPGIAQGEPWIPLLIRRGYLKSLILY